GKRSGWRKPAAIVSVGALAAAALLAWVFRPATRPPMVRYSIPLPPNTRFADYRNPVLAYPVISPAGDRIAIALSPSVGYGSQMWIYQMATAEFRPMAGTEGTLQLSWSPDGGSVVFWADGKYSRLDLSGGAIR